MCEYFSNEKTYTAVKCVYFAVRALWHVLPFANRIDSVLRLTYAQYSSGFDEMILSTKQQSEAYTERDKYEFIDVLVAQLVENDANGRTNKPWCENNPCRNSYRACLVVTGRIGERARAAGCALVVILGA